MRAPSLPTTVSILTPPGRGAVAVIAVDGSQAAALVDQFFTPVRGAILSQRELNRIVYGRWGRELAEDVVACRRGQAQVEVHCHGGAAAQARIVGDLVAAGAIQQPWTEWIAKRELSPIRAAARTALAEVQTERTAAMLLDQYHGVLETAINRVIDSLAAARDADATELIAQLLARAPLGLRLTQPWKVVIAGPPNVGKSSLVNRLLGYARAIVFDQPGTTRDVVTATTALDGWPVELADTAGLGTTNDLLEAAGVDRAVAQAAQADCLVLVLDASQPWTSENQRLIDAWPQALVARNKCDLLTTSSRTSPAGDGSSGVGRPTFATSALTGEGVNALIQAIVQRLVPRAPTPGEPIPFTLLQVERLQESAAALRSGDTLRARKSLLALLAISK